MHPRAFLETFWRLELHPQVFVAMSFAPKYKKRFYTVIAPAIRGITEPEGTRKLTPYRVDLAQSGESNLTAIIDGIAHSQLVLADVSSIGIDSKTKRSYRNGNVMYEVGIALACRHAYEVLLVRDDEDAFLFDVGEVPHIRLDFTNPRSAIPHLKRALVARLHERELFKHARVEIAIAGLSNDEAVVLREVADKPEGRGWIWPQTDVVDSFRMAAIPRLLDKKVIRHIGEFGEGDPAYELTPLGRLVAQRVKTSLRKIQPD